MGRSEKVGGCTGSDSRPVWGTTLDSSQCENKSDDFMCEDPQIGLASARKSVRRAKDARFASWSSTHQNVYGDSANTNGLPANLHASVRKGVAPGEWRRSTIPRNCASLSSGCRLSRPTHRKRAGNRAAFMSCHSDDPVLAANRPKSTGSGRREL